MEYGSRFKALRLDNGWTLDELRKVSGIDKSLLSRLENDIQRPSMAVLETLAQTYHMSLAELLSGVEQGLSTEEQLLIAAYRNGDIMRILKLLVA